MNKSLAKDVIDTLKTMSEKEMLTDDDLIEIDNIFLKRLSSRDRESNQKRGSLI